VSGVPPRAPFGFAVSHRVKVRRRRSVPGAGEIFVRVGDTVRADDVVAAIERPGDVHAINVAARLGLPPGRIREALAVGVGDRIAAGAVIASHRALFGMWTTRVASPVAGTVEIVSPVTGQVVVRTDPTAIELTAYVGGEVVAASRGEGVEIEAEVALLQGALGLGGEAMGVLAIAGTGDGPLAAGDLGEGHRGAVVAAFGRISLEAMCRARELGVAALIGGSARGVDLVAMAGGELNLAATGDEEIGLAIVLSEGLGDRAMSAQAMGLLPLLAGERVSVRGATQVRAGVIRPELVGPPVEGAALEAEGTAAEASIGSRARIVRGRLFGATGAITALPPAPERIETGSSVLVFEILLDGGDVARIPRQNVELAG
jgi:hypothetical protein